MDHFGKKRGNENGKGQRNSGKAWQTMEESPQYVNF
jgi:hypothetical protein